MNLIYHVNVRDMDDEKRKEFDRALGLLEPVPVIGRRRRVPSWYRGTAGAAASSIAAARQLGFAVPEVQ